MEILADAVRTAVAAADAATAGLQQNVTIVRFIADADGLGTPKHDEDGAEVHPALVQRRNGILQTPDGNELRYRAVITLLRPMTFSPRDRIVLADGTTGPILTPSGGLLDPTTGAPFSRTVYVGRS